MTCENSEIRFSAWRNKSRSYRLIGSIEEDQSIHFPPRPVIAQRQTEHYDLQPITLEEAFGLQQQKAVDKTK